MHVIKECEMSGSKRSGDLRTIKNSGKNTKKLKNPLILFKKRTTKYHLLGRLNFGFKFSNACSSLRVTAG